VTILFDLDGTLIDSTEAILESFHRSFDLLGGIHPDNASVKALIGHTLEDMYFNLGVAREEIDTYVRTYKEHYRVISKEKTELLPTAKKSD